MNCCLRPNRDVVWMVVQSVGRTRMTVQIRNPNPIDSGRDHPSLPGSLRMQAGKIRISATVLCLNSHFRSKEKFHYTSGSLISRLLRERNGDSGGTLYFEPKRVPTSNMCLNRSNPETGCLAASVLQRGPIFDLPTSTCRPCPSTQTCRPPA